MSRKKEEKTEGAESCGVVSPPRNKHKETMAEVGPPRKKEQQNIMRIMLTMDESMEGQSLKGFSFYPCSPFTFNTFGVILQ
jgi:hypothetical protein